MGLKRSGQHFLRPTLLAAYVGVIGMSPGRVVLAVVASPADHRLIDACLSSDDITVVAAFSVKEALEKQAEAQAAVVLCDTDVASAWLEAVRLFSGVVPPPRVILVSRLADSQMWVLAVGAGAYDVLAKPFQATELRWVVRGALGRAADA